MIVTPIYDFDIIKTLRNKYIIRIYFDQKSKRHAAFWVSGKQFNRLEECYQKVGWSKVKGTIILCVFDGVRFVWSGVEYPDYSDRQWLMKTFNAEYVDEFPLEEKEVVKHMPERREPINSEPDETLVR